jgi:hypothetical protein
MEIRIQFHAGRSMQGVILFARPYADIGVNPRGYFGAFILSLLRCDAPTVGAHVRIQAGATSVSN